jgi:hypothetical protein
MKTFRALLLIYVTLCVAAPAFGQSATPAYLVTISADKPEVKAGSSVFIRFKLTNISDKVVDCSNGYRGATNVSYEYDVRDGNGKSVEKPVLHPELMTGSWGGPCELKPGEAVGGELLVSSAYDLSNPGTYTIQIARRTTDDRKDDVKSNTVTITVLPADSPPPPQ